MSFGLQNAPRSYQIELLVYLDDVIIFATDLIEHNKKFRRLFNRLRAEKLSLQPDKFIFLVTEVEYLCHVIDEQGVRPDNKKQRL